MRSEIFFLFCQRYINRTLEFIFKGLLIHVKSLLEERLEVSLPDKYCQNFFLTLFSKNFDFK